MTTDTQLIVVRTDNADGLPQRRARGTGKASSPDDRLLATLGRAAPADLPPVSAIGVEVALETMAKASKLAIAADLDCWLAWCAGEHRAPCPVNPEDLVRYLRALEADGRNRRRKGTAQRQAAPLRFGRALSDAGGFTISSMLEASSGDVQGMRDTALLSLGYDAGLRLSELTVVEIKNLRPQPDGSGLLHLPRFKTDQEAQGA